MVKLLMNKPVDFSKVDLKKVGAICSDCAQALGATWPQGHCATWWEGTCDVCQTEKPCSARTDWDWKNKQLSRNREF
jgi:hypothetical protein